MGLTPLAPGSVRSSTTFPAELHTPLLPLRVSTHSMRPVDVDNRCPTRRPVTAALTGCPFAPVNSRTEIGRFMDYCIPCSRTLNGAVTCPECGAYDAGMAQLSDRRSGAPAVEAAMPEVSLSEGPSFSESPLPGSPTAAQDPSTDRYDRPARLKKYAVRSLAAAAFTLLGGLATASVFPQSTAPRAASIPEQPSHEEPEVRVPDPQASPERVTTHPARKGVRDRSDDGIRRPVPTATRSTSPASRPPATTSAPPPVKAKPTPRSSSGRRPSSPSQTATPSARPSASPSLSPSPSPSVSISASPTGASPFRQG